MGRVAVIVDAGYVFKAGGQLVAAREIARLDLRLDIGAAARLITETATELAGKELLRIYWYDASSKWSETSHRDIANHPYVKLRLGHLNSAGQQKGVDPLIITDMITLARNRACEDIVLISGDADLVVGVQQAQEQGVRVHLVGIAPARANQAPTLRQEADTCSEWDKSRLENFLREDAKGEPATATQSVSNVPGRQRHKAPRDRAPTTAAATGAVTDAGVTISDALLSTVADAVAEQLSEPERDAVLAGERGFVPGDVDRQLFGIARRMLQTLLAQPEKRLLRQLLYDRCASLKGTNSRT
jgi:uncharacterized LabA/DUF88 family protein